MHPRSSHRKERLPIALPATMSNSKESTELARQILTYFDKNFQDEVYAWRQNTTGIPDGKGHLRTAAKVGITDIVACAFGAFVGIEIKTGKDRLRVEQIGFIKNIKHRKGIAIVVHDFEDFLSQWETVWEGIIKKTYGR